MKKISIKIIFILAVTYTQLLAAKNDLSGLSFDFNVSAGYPFASAPKSATLGAFQGVGWRKNNQYFGLGIDLITSQLYDDFSRRGIFVGAGPEYHRFIDLNDTLYLRYGPTFALGRFEKKANPNGVDYYAFGYSAIWQTSIGLKLNADSEKNALSAYYFNLELITALTYTNLFERAGRTDTELLNGYVGIKVNFVWDLRPIQEMVKQYRDRT
ncbi:MAG: hypothetical protein LDLANPLL_01811 [Turneriella sp.]|nr:hypothetical protein [Turneriella sp.]